MHKCSIHIQKSAKYLNNQKGQTLIEYLIIVALVGVGSVALMRSVGQNVNAQFAQVVHALGGEVEGNRRAAKVSANAYKKKDLKNFVSGSIGSGNNSNNSDDNNE